MADRKINAMHKEYGITHIYHQCKECCNFVKGRYHDTILRKCKAYGLTHSEATDWAGKNDACGMFGVPFEATKRTPLIDVLKHNKKEIDNTPLDGQEEF